ncbi:hypothetical protein Patl1_16287 [Pistacia atlantica]|uniref:Uncharacterized protein n=1 Tax=Pistacia atlantica TaxID=434234 RepID=A0ACC1BAI4_9ROSI|nr:hypothetical protein Patl1_16287 [Pistacia atlantica]
MARATTLSPPCVIARPPCKLRHSSLPPPLNLPFHNYHKILRLSIICHGQVSVLLSFIFSFIDGKLALCTSNFAHVVIISWMVRLLERLMDIDDEAIFDDLMVDDDITSDDEDDTESSVDLLIRFLQTMFKKLSKRAKKASLSILPYRYIFPAGYCVSFAVDGILLLAILSILKALLEVACTLGATVFVGILLLRVVWAASSYLQSNGSGFNQGGNSFRAT